MEKCYLFCNESINFVVFGYNFVDEMLNVIVVVNVVFVGFCFDVVVVNEFFDIFDCVFFVRSIGNNDVGIYFSIIVSSFNVYIMRFGGFGDDDNFVFYVEEVKELVGSGNFLRYDGDLNWVSFGD